MSEVNNICFFIAPIGDPDSDVRKRSDQILKHIVQPAAMSCGYDAIRADQLSEPGIITTQVIQHIIDDPMIVADLTGRNPNVFYELALRHALRKPYVQIIERGERIPFDVAAIRTIEVDHHDLDSVESAKAEIIRQMQSMTEAHGEIDSPISIAVDLEMLRQSGNPEQRQLADMLSSMAELRSAIAPIEKRLGDPTALVPPAYLRDIVFQELRPMITELVEAVRRPQITPRAFEEIIFSLQHLSKILDPSEGEIHTKTELDEARELAQRLDHMIYTLAFESSSLSKLGSHSPEQVAESRHSPRDAVSLEAA